MSRILRWLPPVLIALMVLPGAVRAGDEARTLGGFVFPPTLQVPDPFVTTDFSSRVGGGMYLGADFPILVVEQDTLLSLNGNLAFVNLGFAYRHAASERVGFRFSANVASRLGASGEALLAQGVSAVTRLGVGTTLSLHRSDRLQVSGVADLLYGPVLKVDLVRFLEDFVDHGLDAASLVRTDDGIMVSGGVRAAYAFSRWIGGYGQFEVGHRNSVYTEDTGVMGGAAVVFDFGQKGGLPVALSGLLRTDGLTLRTEDEGSQFGIGAGVAYTGRRDFHLGLEVLFSRLPIKTEEDLTFNGFTLDLVSRYYF